MAIKTQIKFVPLDECHFPLLLKWLLTSYVRLWWDQDINWTAELIAKKYSTYVKRYKRLIINGKIIEKPIYPYIIYYEDNEIGYIQYYNKHDFPPEQGYDTNSLPNPLAALDFYIGEPSYLGKGLGKKILILFLKNYIFTEFDACFVDPDTSNTKAIITYQKAGFEKYTLALNDAITCMIAYKNNPIFTISSL